MSNATDSLVEAEKMIKDSLLNKDDQEKAMQICSWLLDFNRMENNFKVKCYSTKIPDICFCVDRGGDCETEKIKTWFFRIRINQLMFFRLIKPNGTYLKLQSGRSNADNTFIKSSESKKLNLDKIKKHILDAYEQQLNQLGMVPNAKPK